MKPLRLVMTAFGPYASRQEVDFRNLGDRRFFLIHGPTGSGKTSILDAVTFALYGESAGENREGRNLRSDHASPDVATSVVFDFAVGADVYRVERLPEQSRPKLRGEGMVTSGPKGTLWRRTGCARDDEEGSVLETKASRVTERIEEILGFRGDQFRQVILLPQGRFQRFLESTSKDRETILEVLFDTGRYARITEAVKAAAAKLAREVEEARGRRAFLLAQARVARPDELAEREAALAKNVAELTARVKKARKARDAARKLLEAAQKANAKLEEKAAAEKAMADLDARREVMAVTERRLGEAQRAAILRDAEENLRDRAATEETARRALVEAVALLEKALAAKTAADAALEAEKKREPERKDLEAQAARMTEMKTRLAAVEKGREEISGEEKAHRIAQANVDALEKAIQKSVAGLDAARRDVKTQAKTAGCLAARELGLKAANERLEAARNLEGKAAHAALLLEERTAKAANHAAAADELAQAKTHLEATQAAWERGQAAILAASLVGGEPCPVCGSCQHPSPALSQVELPTEAALKRQREAMAKAEKAEVKLREELAAAQSAHAGAQGEVEALRGRLGEAAAVDAASLETRIAEAHALFQGARAAALALATLEKQIQELEATSAEDALKKKDADNELAQVNDRLAKARGVLQERLAGIPEDLREPEALDTRLAKTTRQLTDLVAAFEKAQRTAQEAAETLASRATAHTGAEATLRTAAEAAAKARTEFTARLRKHNFADEAAYRAAALDPDAMEVLDKEVQEYRLARAAAEKRLERAREAAKDLATPALQDLEARAAELDGEVEQVGNELTLAEKDAATLADLAKQLRELEEKDAALEARYQVVGRLAEVASGKNPHRMTLQRFVLASLLDDVLQGATQRLHGMTQSRFTLQRAATPADQRATGGLDLEVYDAHTETARPVSTLSGGESFQAALSLALGLADTVHARTGGIRLETMFVDEGFGSLDSEALDLALNTLLKLQEGGRLVGIISHVEGLPDRIDVRLEVTPGRRGSSARFVLP